MTTPVQDFAKFYSGNGATTSFPYTWKTPEASHLRVVTRDSAAAGELLKVLNVDYTVTGVGSAAGGNVVFGVAPANGAIVAVINWPPLAQEVSVQNSTKFFPRAIEDALDRLERQMLRHEGVLKRCLKVPETENVTEGDLTLPAAAERAGGVVGFDGTGKAMSLVTIPEDSVAISAFGANVVNTANASALLDLLGVTAFVKTVLDDTTAAAVRDTIGVDYSRVTPSNISAQQDNYAALDNGDRVVHARLTFTSVVGISGFTGGSQGKILVLQNVGSVSGQLLHDITSTAANRLKNFQSATVTLQPGDVVIYLYDDEAARWLQIA